MKSICVTYAVFFFLLSHMIADEAPKRETLLNILNLIQETIPCSTHHRKDIENHQIVFNEINTVIEKALYHYPDDQPIETIVIRLLYTQSNYYLYTDRLMLAQKQLLIAKGLCEKKLQAIEFENANSIEQICHQLVAIDSRLPSFYAMVLRLLSKAYVFTESALNQSNYIQGEKLLRKAIQIREYIDSQSETQIFNDRIDNNPIVGNTHIFKRDLCYILLDKGNWEEAENKFIKLLEIPDSHNRLMCLKNLLKIYLKQAQLRQEDEKRKEFYQKALACATEVLTLIEQDPSIYRISSIYNLIGELYYDPQNPIRDLKVSLKLLEKAKDNCPEELKSISSDTHQKLSNLYQEFAFFHKLESKQKKWDYTELSIIDYLKEKNLKHDCQFLAYEKLGDLYLEKNEFETAIILYSNALSLVEETSFPIFNKNQLLRKMENVEKTFYPTFQNNLCYSTLLNKYKNFLSSLRQKTKEKLYQESTTEIFEFVTREYKTLLQIILQDLIVELNENVPSFALICGGSLSWGMATPYSDLELAFLIPDNLSKIEKEFIHKLSKLLTLRLSAIGETPAGYIGLDSLNWLSPDHGPSPRGFMLDPFQLKKTYKYFIGTVDELAHFQKEGLCHLPHLQLSFMHFSLVFGDFSLPLQYEQVLERVFSKEERILFFQNQLKRDLSRWELKNFQDSSGEKCSVKHDLYRPLDVFLHDLALLFWIREKTLFDLLDALENKKLIDPIMIVKGRQALELAGKLRIQNYLQAKCESEWIHPQLEEIIIIRSFLKLFHEYMKTFLPMNEEIIPDDIDSLANQLTAKITFYGNNHPKVAEARASIALAFMQRGHYFEAIDQFNKAIQSDQIIYGNQHPRLLSYQENLNHCKNKLSPQCIIPHFQCSKNCKEGNLAKSHPFYKAYHLHKQALDAINQGNKNLAHQLFSLCAIVSTNELY